MLPNDYTEEKLNNKTAINNKANNDNILKHENKLDIEQNLNHEELNNEKFKISIKANKFGIYS